MSENDDLLTFHNLLAENTRLKSENKKLNQAYENAEKVATERLAEIRELKTEVDRLNRLLAPYTDRHNWYENKDLEHVFSYPYQIDAKYPWKLGGKK